MIHPSITDNSVSGNVRHSATTTIYIIVVKLDKSTSLYFVGTEINSVRIAELIPTFHFYPIQEKEMEPARGRGAGCNSDLETRHGGRYSQQLYIIVFYSSYLFLQYYIGGT